MAIRPPPQGIWKLMARPPPQGHMHMPVPQVHMHMQVRSVSEFRMRPLLQVVQVVCTDRGTRC